MIKGKSCKVHPTVLSFGNDIEIGDNVRIDAFCVLTGKIRIGNDVHIACGCYLYGMAGIEMQDYSGLSSRVTIYSTSDDYSGEYMFGAVCPDEYKNVHKAKVTLGRYVIVGCNSTIMPGVKVGEGVAVGAYSFVKSDCKPWSIYTGVPAKMIKERSMKLLEQELRWQQHRTS